MTRVEKLLLASMVCCVAASPQCRIHTDAVAATAYPWRNAYTPSHVVADVPGDPNGFDTHEYAYCNGGKGPWAYNASGISVEQCADKCRDLKCSCFDFYCEYHEAANCTCPTMPKITPDPNAQKVACVGDSITGELQGRQY